MLWEKKHAGLLHLKRSGDWKVACYSWWNFLLANYARASEIETWEKTRIQDTYLAVGRAMYPKQRRPKSETVADNRPPGRVRPLASLASCQCGYAHPDDGETFDTSEDGEVDKKKGKEIEGEREEFKRKREEITRQREGIVRKLEQIRGEREEVKTKERRLRKKERILRKKERRLERWEMKRERGVCGKYGEVLKRYAEEKDTTVVK
ncbi:hypothetical protein OCU04_001197 [Sclerotinia nivalis]|uniref:Uncharacterized protein n=1 Tax=Sclerotinia nivalis TaxID=352851 RepID=A0A9X0AXL7_9HELO|nr:hypothetical protein OCU04_001197 [Sclerotinia nivalis]